MNLFSDRPCGRFCDNKNLFFENGRQKINLIIIFLKNEKIWILKMLYGKHLLDFWNTCTFFKIFFTCQLAMFLSVRQTPWCQSSKIEIDTWATANIFFHNIFPFLEHFNMWWSCSLHIRLVRWQCKWRWTWPKKLFYNVY